MKKTIIKALALFLSLSLVVSIIFIAAPQNSSAATYYRIKNAWNSTYLYENSGQVKYGTPAATDATSQWEMISYNGNTQLKNVATGNFMHVQNQLAHVESSAITATWTSAQWIIETYNGNKRIKNVAYNTKFINIEGLAGYAKCTTIYDVWASAQWILETVTVTTTPTPSPTATPTPTPAVTPTPTTTPVAGIDLVVTNITWTPANPATGNEVTFSAVIKNQGGTSSPGGVKHGISFMVNGTQVNWADNFNTSLAPGATATVTANGGPSGKATWTATSGTPTVRAFVDDVNLINESNETNNTMDKAITIGASASPTPTPTPTTTTAPSPTPAGGRGATVPWTSYEAESGSTNASVLGPNRTIGDPAGEASGRKAVKLAATGQYVQWTVTNPANALVVRYSMPDAAGGNGINSTISVYKNGTHIQDLAVTSKYAWLYGANAWTEDGLTQNPADGTPRHIYDESNTILSASFAAGDVIKLQKDSGDTASYYTIDFIELENVAPLSQPANSISITSKGAVAGGPDCASAIESAIADAKTQGKIVWIPQGTFYHSRKMNASGVTIKGAGMWYSKLYAYNSGAQDVNWNNNIGFNVDSGAKFYDFQVIGEATKRNTGGKAFSGPFGTGTELYNIWVEHANCGVWAGVDYSPSLGTSLVFEGCRFRNVFADGINICNGTQNSVIRNCTSRNTGDDGFAIWAEGSYTPRNSYNNTIQNCTAQLPWRAAGIAIYGGESNKVLNNKVIDTLTYPGITVSSGFGAKPFAGTTVIQNNELIRCGGLFWGDNQQFGAIWLFACDSNITAGINFIGNDIYDSTFSGIHIQCANSKSITGSINFDDLDIVNTGTNGIIAKSGSVGSVRFSNTRLSGIGSGARVQNDSGGAFSITQGTGNTGW